MNWTNLASDYAWSTEQITCEPSLADSVKRAADARSTYILKNIIKRLKVLTASMKTGQRMLNTVHIKLGCGIEKELYESHTGRGRATLTQYETWRETLTVPGKGTERVELTCPTCHNSFEVKVHSKSKARRRKIGFASIFFAIAMVAVIFGAFAGWERGFIGYSIGAVFIYFTLWQLFNVIRGKFDATDLVVQVRGKRHRIFE